MLSADVTAPPLRQLFVWERRILYATKKNVTDWHRHFGASIAVSVGPPFRLESRKEARDFTAALVPPNLEHRALVDPARMVVLIADPDSRESASLLRRGNADRIVELDHGSFRHLVPLFDSILENPGNAALAREAADGMMAAMSDESGRTGLDPRIEHIVSVIRGRFPDVPAMNYLAKEVDLSPNRLMTLFKKNLGLPIRRYLLWVRMRDSVRHLRGGRNLTEAAHAAGFADSAHLSRVFRGNFGMRPSDFFAPNASVSVHFDLDPLREKN